MIKNIIVIVALMMSALCASQNIEKPVMMKQKSEKVQKVASVHWESDFKTAIEKAQIAHKPLMLVVSKKSCKWCYHYKENALVDPLVVKAINRDFIALMIEMEDGGLPKELWTPGTPATWFLDNTPQPMYQPLMGSQPASTLLNAFGIIMKDFNEPPVTKEVAKK